VYSNCNPVINIQETEFTVKNVQTRGGYILHIGEVEGVIKKGDLLIQHLDTVLL